MKGPGTFERAFIPRKITVLAIMYMKTKGLIGDSSDLP